jgi:hypothetical protein
MFTIPAAAAGLLLTCLTLFNPTEVASASSRPPVGSGALPVLNVEQRTMYTAAFEQYAIRTYVQAGLVNTGLPVTVFRKALVGYYHLQQQGAVKARQPLLTIIDFSRASNQKRLWVINLATARVVFHTLVAHGKNTGEQWAQTFSNREGSEMSSLGFYVTGETYQGKHGLSLKLRGLDPGYNTNAASRAVVVHGADYVSESFIRQHGRLGRSQGCPALPVGQSGAIIKVIKNGSVVFANGPASVAYQSDWLGLDPALLAFARSTGLADS